MKREYPKNNEQRLCEGFLWLPKTSKGFYDGSFRETRWLEYAYWKETYYKNVGWVCYYFMTKDEYKKE